MCFQSSGHGATLLLLTVLIFTSVVSCKLSWAVAITQGSRLPDKGK